MKNIILITLALTSLARAELFLVVDSRQGITYSGDRGDALLVDFGAKDRTAWSVYTNTPGHTFDLKSMPAWVETDGSVVSYAANPADAEADQRAKHGPAWKDLKQFIGKRPTYRSISAALLDARNGCATATTYAIQRVAATNELHLMRLVHKYNIEMENFRGREN